jgi:predicted metal-dependent phosphoesterase TrpH
VKVQSRFVEPDRPPGYGGGLPNTLDLHVHTDRSDGVLPPAELYHAMAECGLQLAAVADHDTLAGYRALTAAGLGLETAGEGGPRLIPAVEINSVADRELLELGVELEEGELHVLGYGMDPDDERFEQTLAAQRGARRSRFLLIIEALRRAGVPIDDEIAPALASEEALGRPHIARAMVAAGHVADVQQAFDVWIERGRPGYVPRQGVGTRAAIDAITAAGGLPVLAHYPAAPEQAALMRVLLDWGLRGLEVYYRRFSDQTVARMVTAAADYGLTATGGSDYHGDGMSYAEAWRTTYVPAAAGEALLAALSQTQAVAR